eukprot:SAG31_NODE_3008_length_4790_cov_327.591132_3_plen_177_part_00
MKYAKLESQQVGASRCESEWTCPAASLGMLRCVAARARCTKHMAHETKPALTHLAMPCSWVSVISGNGTVLLEVDSMPAMTSSGARRSPRSAAARCLQFTVFSGRLWDAITGSSRIYFFRSCSLLMNRSVYHSSADVLLEAMLDEEDAGQLEADGWARRPQTQQEVFKVSRYRFVC